MSVSVSLVLIVAGHSAVMMSVSRRRASLCVARCCLAIIRLINHRTRSVPDVLCTSSTSNRRPTTAVWAHSLLLLLLLQHQFTMCAFLHVGYKRIANASACRVDCIIVRHQELSDAFPYNFFPAEKLSVDKWSHWIWKNMEFAFGCVQLQLELTPRRLHYV